VAIAGGGPGGISAALALLKAGYDVRIFERRSKADPRGGAVVLSTPVLMILRHYGVDVEDFLDGGTMWFSNSRGKLRVKLPVSTEIEHASGMSGFTHSGLRSAVCGRLAALLPSDVLQVGDTVTGYEETPEGVRVFIEGREPVVADMLVGADGINSNVSRQSFGDPGIFHLGIKAFLAHCGAPLNREIPRDHGLICHSDRFQVSYFPLIHDGQNGFEWWVVEKFCEGSTHPTDPKAHVRKIVADFESPVRDLVEVTDFDRCVYQWEIYNRKQIDTWSKGRVVCLGDAVHPVSPYAGYGLGMAIEDGYFIARSLEGCDLRDLASLQRGFQKYEGVRVQYVNKHVAFARTLGNVFHKVPWPLSRLRDMFFDNTGFLAKGLTRGYLEDVFKETMDLRELHRP
jgi:2-polyprenyl-6-methoxyphenol hydroxylase-like FAD-dependent oxidoreductase